MPKTVLVTGASGFIGSHLVSRFLADGYSVHLFLRESSDPKRIQHLLKRVTVHSAMYHDLAFMKKTVASIAPDYIFNLSTFGGYPFQTRTEEILISNIVQPMRLLEALSDVPFSGFVTTGSSSEYGSNARPMRETDIPKPDSFYAAAKTSMTHLAQVYARTFRKPVVVVRPFSVYGPFEEESRLVPTVIRKALSGDEILLTKGLERRDFIFIDDVIEGMKRIALAATQYPGEIFNLGTGRECSTRQVVRKIMSLTKSTSPLRWGAYPNRSWDLMHWRADMRRTKKRIAWKPSHSLNDGLKKTILWYTRQKFGL